MKTTHPKKTNQQKTTHPILPTATSVARTVITLVRYDAYGKKQKPVKLSWDEEIEVVFRPKAA